MQELLDLAGGTYTFSPTFATVTISGLTLTVNEIDSIINVTRDNQVLYDISDPPDSLTLIGSTFHLSRATHGMAASDELQIIIEVAGGGSGSGDVIGPGSAVGNNVVFFNGSTGKLIRDSGLTLSGSNTGDQFSSTTASKLIGRESGSAGVAEEITLGTNLSMSGTTLNATGGGGSGDVVGPASAVGDHVVFFNSTTGKLIKDSGLALSGSNTGDQDISGLATKAGLQAEAYTAADDTGTANAYAISITPTPTLAAYSWFSFKVANSNTGASTLAINGGAAKSIKKWGGLSNLTYGDLVAGQIVRVIYDGTNFQMQSQAAAGTNSYISILPPITGPGTVSNGAGGTTVTGVGTTFTKTFVVGDVITIPTAAGMLPTTQQQVVISNIASDTSMTTATITSANSGVAYDAIAFTGVGSYSSTPLFIKGVTDDFFQTNIQNLSTGVRAQSGYSATMDTGSNITGFAWLGVNNSGFNYASAYNIGAAGDINVGGVSTGHDVYLWNGDSAGNMFLSTGGTAAANQRLKISAAGAVTFPNSGSVNLPWVAKSTTYLAVAGNRILADTSGGAFTITLPATPSVGDQVYITDTSGTFGTYNLTIGRNSTNIMGTAADYVLNVANANVSLVYAGATPGWRIMGMQPATVGLMFSYGEVR